MASGVHAYLVTTPPGEHMDLWAATAPVANWIESRAGVNGVTWQVMVMAADGPQFLDIARKLGGITVEEIEGTGANERYVMLAGEPGSGWQAADDDRTPYVRIHDEIEEALADITGIAEAFDAASVVMPIVEAAVAAERERIRQLADRNNAVCTGEEGTSCWFSALITEPQERSDEKEADRG